MLQHILLVVSGTLSQQKQEEATPEEFFLSLTDTKDQVHFIAKAAHPVLNDHLWESEHLVSASA